MVFKILIGLLWPFIKEVLFGRSDDEQNKKVVKKKLAHRITDFFMKSHRATSALILFSAASLVVTVISIRKVTAIALYRENTANTSQIEDIKDRVYQKPDDKIEITMGEEDHLENTRNNIIQRLENL